MLSHGKIEVLTYRKDSCRFGININLCALKALHITLFALWTFTSVHAESPVSNAPILLAESPISVNPKINSEVTVEGDTEQWSIHGQSTYIVQQKNNFNSPYYGQNSLLNKSEGGGGKSYTFSATAFLGARLWDGAEVYWNPEMFEGTPFNGQLVGLGGFQNGELQKGAYAPPIYYTARASPVGRACSIP